METSDMKILIVDDFELARTMLKGVLEQAGVKNIVQAQDGLEAIEKLNQANDNGAPFNIIFCDWKMPNFTGYQMLLHCKESPLFKHVPFIMVTAEADRPSVLKALTSGATDYLIKPFNAKEINAKISKLLELNAA